MADHFLSGLPNLKLSFSLSDIEPNIEFMNHFPGQNTIHPEITSSLIGYPNDNLFSHCSEIPGNLLEAVPGLFNHLGNNVVPSSPDRMISAENDRQEKKKRKSTDISTPESSTANSFQDSDNGIRRKNITGKGKKVKNNEKEEEKPREVVHVRAKRGQATDSHSLAERVRREKINERIRCLQDIVPGCYKTMGMAVMLDEIIHYVQSLQNQVEFLSMKLNAATTFYDFNSDTDVIEAMQRAKAMEALKIQKIASQEFASVQFPPLDLNSGYYLQFPHNT